MTIREITEEIGALYERMKSAVEGSQASGEPMSAEDKATYEANSNRLTQLIEMRDQHYRLLDVAGKAQSMRDSHKQSIAETRGLSSHEERKMTRRLDGDEYRSAFTRYLQVGLRDLTDSETRALSEGTDADGGFIPTTEFYATLVEKRLQANAMRQIANVIPMGSFKTDIVLESGYGTAAYTAEAAAVNESSPTFGNVVLSPYTLRYFTKVSNELLADAPSRGPGFSIESILSKQIGKVMGEKEEATFTEGDGSSKPKGIFTYTSGSVISKITTAASQAIGIADLMKTVYALPRQYRANAKWVMTDSIFAKIRELLMVQTTTVGGTPSGIASAYSPLGWSMGDGRLQDGEPDRLLGFPVVCVAQGPTFPTSGAKIVACFGDFDYYHIGERESISIKVARETYLANNQTGYFAFARHDAKASILDAFRYLEIKA